ncbi:MAG: cytochrome P450 [Bacteroidota bacterium]
MMNSTASKPVKDEYYLFYEFLREKPPIKLEGSWLLSKYEDVKHILENPQQFSSCRIPLLFAEFDKSNKKIHFAESVLSEWLNHTDADTAKIKGALINELYTYFNTKLEAAVLKKLKACLAETDKKEIYDFRNEVAIPLMSYLVIDILGLPRDENTKLQEEQIFKHMQRIAYLLSKLRLTVEEAEGIADSLLFIIKLGANYDGKVDDFPIEEYRTDYSNPEMQKGAVFHAFVHDSTNLLCNALMVLDNNRDKFTPETIDLAINEVTRMEAPVQALVRVPQSDFELRGQKIAKGEIVTLFIGSANRDGEMEGFENPDEFMLNRKRKPLSFGHGKHSCVGQHMAKKITKTVMLELFTRDNFKIEDIKWEKDSRVYRNMEHLMIRNV